MPRSVVLAGAARCPLPAVQPAATVGREWLFLVGAMAPYIEFGSRCEYGYVEGFNRKIRDDPLHREVFDTLTGAKVLIEPCRTAYNTVRQNSRLGYRCNGPGVAVAIRSKETLNVSHRRHHRDLGGLKTRPLVSP